MYTVGEYAACANTGGQGSQLAECDVTTAPPTGGAEPTEPAGAETTTFAAAPDSGSSQRKMKENMKLNLAKVSRIHPMTCRYIGEGVVGSGMGLFPDCGPLAEDSATKLKRGQLNVCVPYYVWCSLFPPVSEI